MKSHTDVNQFSPSGTNMHAFGWNSLCPPNTPRPDQLNLVMHRDFRLAEKGFIVAGASFGPYTPWILELPKNCKISVNKTNIVTSMAAWTFFIADDGTLYCLITDPEALADFRVYGSQSGFRLYRFDQLLGLYLNFQHEGCQKRRTMMMKPTIQTISHLELQRCRNQVHGSTSWEIYTACIEVLYRINLGRSVAVRPEGDTRFPISKYYLIKRAYANAGDRVITLLIDHGDGELRKQYMTAAGFPSTGMAWRDPC